MRVKPKLIIKCLRQNNFDFTVTARSLSLHRATVYRWWNKYRKARYKRQLARISSRPKHIHRHEFTNDERVRIEEYRLKRHPTAERIVAKLDLSVSSRTVHRFLKAKGLVREYRYYRRPKFQNTIHMHAKNTPHHRLPPV